MARKPWWLGVAAALGVLAIVGFGIAAALSSNRVSAFVGEREVAGFTRNAFSPARLSATESDLTLTLGEASVAVTHATVSLPGGRVHAIPTGCRRIEVRETSTGLTLTFDGVPVE